jgi:hypothetical protein
VTDTQPAAQSASLHPAEVALIAATQRGEVYTCSTLTVNQLSISDELRYTVRAEVIREMILGTHGNVNVSGIQLEGARVTGSLRLNHVVTDIGLSLHRCTIAGTVSLEHAQLSRLSLQGSRLSELKAESAHIKGNLNLDGVQALDLSQEFAIWLSGAKVDGDIAMENIEISNTGGVAIVADGLRADFGVNLNGARLVGSSPMGTVRLLGVRINGQLQMQNAIVTNDSGPALSADEIRVDGSVILFNSQFAGKGGHAAVLMPGARITGNMMATGVRIENTAGGALVAERLEVGGNLFFTGMHASGAGELGTLNLRDADISGTVYGQKSSFENKSGPCINAEQIRVAGNMLLSEMVADSSWSHGAVRMSAARISGQLNFRSCLLSNDIGPALECEALFTQFNLVVRYAKISGAGQLGALRLHSGEVRGELSGEEVEIRNDSGPALHAEGLRVSGNLILDRAQIHGSGEFGAIRLFSASIGGQLGVTEASVSNYSGVAIHADAVRIGSALFLVGSTVEGASEIGLVRIPYARIGTELCLNGSRLSNKTGTALIVDSIQVDGIVTAHGLKADGAGELAVIRLRGAQIAGEFLSERISVTHTGEGVSLDLSGVTVKKSISLPVSSLCPDLNSSTKDSCNGRVLVDFDELSYAANAAKWEDWIHFIRMHTEKYTPSPYQQLATIERNAGHDSNVRQIMIFQQKDRLKRAPSSIGSRLSQISYRAWGALSGYGYRTRRAAFFLGLILFASGACGYIAGQIETRPQHHVAERVSSATEPLGVACSSIELVGVGLDRGLPLGSTGVRNRCDIDTTSRRGQAFTLLIWLLQAAIWILATLVIAGYTGLVRKVG